MNDTTNAAWEILPDTPLPPGTPLCDEFLALGRTTLQDAARYVQELPYGRNSKRDDYRLVLSERRGTCSTKHALVADLAHEVGVDAQLHLGIYFMTAANTPAAADLLQQYNLDSIPEAHVFMTYKGVRVDLTRVHPSEEAVSEGTSFDDATQIVPQQIGTFKRAYHQAYMRKWLAMREDLAALDFETVWGIREACIEALSAS